MPIEIPFLANVSGFIGSAGNVEDALDNIADALDDVGEDATDSSRTAERALSGISDAAQDVGSDVESASRDATRALDDVADAATDAGDDTRDAARDMERALGDAGDAGRDAGQDLERGMREGVEGAEEASADMLSTFRQNLDAVRAEARTAGDAVGREMSDGADEAGEGVQQLSEEAGANAREVAASFDGSAASIADGFQGLAAEALGGFGPAGAAAGIAVAAGMGLAMSSMEKAKEQAQETATEIAEIAGALIDIGKGANVRSGDLVNERLKEMATTAEEGANELLGVRDAANDLGIDFTNLARAMAGDSDSAAKAIAEINTKVAELNELNNASYGAAYNSAAGKANSERRETINQLEAQRQSIADVNGILDEGTEIYDLYNDSLVESETQMQETQDAVDAMREAQEAATEATRDATDAAIEGSNAQIAYMESVEGATTTISENGATLDLATEAGRANQGALNDLAASTLSLSDANKVNGAATDESNAKLREGREAFIRAAEAAGMTTDAANALADSYGLVPGTVSTNAVLYGAENVSTSLNNITAERYVPLSATYSQWSWQNTVDAAAAGLRRPRVNVDLRYGDKAV